MVMKLQHQVALCCCCMQVVVQAVRTLSTCFLAVPAQENVAQNEVASGAASDAPHALSVVAKHGALLHESLTKVRYHQIKHCRDVASEALSILKSMLPAAAFRSAPPEKQEEKSVAKKSSKVSRRKGPWLHQRRSGGVGDMEADSCSTPVGTPTPDPSAASATLAAAQRCGPVAVSHFMCCLVPHNIIGLPPVRRLAWCFEWVGTYGNCLLRRHSAF